MTEKDNLEKWEDTEWVSPNKEPDEILEWWQEQTGWVGVEFCHEMAIKDIKTLVNKIHELEKCWRDQHREYVELKKHVKGKIAVEEDLEELLNLNDWDLECESPLEIRHMITGSFVTGEIAQDIIDELIMTK